MFCEVRLDCCPRQGICATEMCTVLDVSISGYRAWKRGGTPDRKRLTDSQMLAVIRAIHAELKGAYSSPRMVRELRGRGFAAANVIGTCKLTQVGRWNLIHLDEGIIVAF
jgi:hypothetical protein